MPHLHTNPTLLEAFRRGEREALSAIYDAHVDAVSTVIRLGFNLDVKNAVRIPGILDADQQGECIQEVFLRAFSRKSRHAYDGQRPYKPYLLRIAKNLLIDRLRRTRPEISLDTEILDSDLQPLDDAMSIPDSAEASADVLHWRALRQATLLYLQNVERETRRFIHLRYEMMQTQDQVAEALGVSRRHVRTLERRCAKALRTHLRKLGF
ncbi:MAG: sigma-70 family RNA polymerase sigma factor [Myxococcota bacterium]